MSRNPQLPGGGLERALADPALDRLREALGGTPAYLVGGSVRDALLGGETIDLDVAVEGELEPLLERLGGALREHARFGTATVEIDGRRVDLARTRAERYHRPGALPEVEPAGIEQDLARRDFSINAIAVPLTGPSEPIDPHGGRADLESGTLRVLHPGSFGDDPTRALRGARYAARFGLRPDPQTAALLGQVELSDVSADRRRAELARLAAEPEALAAFDLLDRWGVLPLGRERRELLSRVSALLDAEPWAGELDRTDALLAAAEAGEGELERARELAGADPGSPSEGFRLARGKPARALLLARALGGEWIDEYLADWRPATLAIGGDDLLAAGVPAGPPIGRGLRAALDALLDGRVGKDPEEQLRIALAAARDDPG